MKRRGLPAARAHLQSFNPVVRQALDQAGLRLGQINAVAVTTGPGLSRALQVGLAGAKSLAYAAGVPLHGAHHLAGHVAADTPEHGPLPTPCVVLIVPGGHTSLLLVRDLVREPILHLGDTLDDAAGECFDKVARILGLPCPGGPAIDRAARDGDPRAVHLPPSGQDTGSPPLSCADFRERSTASRRAVVLRHRGRPGPASEVEQADRRGAGPLWTAGGLSG